MSDQLEIIHASGDIRFVPLDVSKGVTNIGRHPDNDVVLDSPAVDLFHAILDHRQQPYQLMLLSPNANPRVGGQPLMPNAPTTLKPWDTLELDGFVLMVVEGGGETTRTATPGPRTLVAQRPPVASPPATPRATAPSPPVSMATPPAAPSAKPTKPVTKAKPKRGWFGKKETSADMEEDDGRLDQMFGRLVDLPPEQTSSAILVEYEVGDFALDVEKKSSLDFSVEVRQTATFTVTISNGGDLVATFELEVLGVPLSWVSVSPAEVNLNENERAAVQVSITPPRAPTVWAGAHYFAVSVMSPNYPGQRHVTSGALLIKPYQDFALDELSPKEQTIPWRKRFGRVKIPVSNNGNGDELYRLNAEDNENGCNFEFDVKDSVPQTRAVEVLVPANSQMEVDARIFPARRQFIGFTSRTYNYTVTVSPTAGSLAPRSLLGQVRTTPLIGPVLIILFILTVIAAIVWLSWPRVYAFTARNGDVLVTTESGRTLFINAGDLVTLNWETAPFYDSLRLINQDTKEVINEIPASSEPNGTLVLSPTTNTKYLLEVRSWLTALSDSAFRKEVVIPVNVAPVYPSWVYYTGGEKNILRGQSVVYSWKVRDAEQVFLITRVNNVDTRTPVAAELVGEGSLTLSPVDATTTYLLEARNRYTPDQGIVVTQSLVINLLDPTTTPLPAPVIVRFDIQPEVITKGDSIKVDWAVDGVVAGVTKVQLLVNNAPSEVAPTGSLEFFPTDNTTYQLVATTGDIRVETSARTVRVNPPAPTPQAPTISYFLASPTQVVQSSLGASPVTLTWSIVGNVTAIKITGPEIGEVTVSDKTGTYVAAITKLTQFVLTAYNGDLSTSATAQVVVVAPTPTSTPLPTPTPTPVPPSIIITATAENAPADRVQFISYDLASNTYNYKVVYGTTARFAWTATNAAQVLFEGVPNPPTGFKSKLIISTTPIKVDALNAQNTTTTAFILITLAPKIPPPAPYNVNGPSPSASPPLTLTWSYDTSALVDLTRFRIYRADVPGAFSAVAEVPANTTQWIDTNGGCGKAYYVLGLYYDVDGVTLLETSPSTNSWYSQPCP
jgi:hypothetical protein